MGYQFFLPMVLRWRASRAEAPLILLQCYHGYSHYFGINADFIGGSPQESCRQLEEATSQLTPVCVESSIFLWNLLLKRSRIYKTQKEKKNQINYR